MMTRYWLVFKDAPEWYLRWLKPGFRHLWIHGCDNGVWFSVDLGARGLEIDIDFMVDWTRVAPGASTFEVRQRYQDAVDKVTAWWAAQGYTAVPVTPGFGGKTAYLGVLSCVGVAKRFLGVRAPWVLTPAQLHRYVVKRQPAPEPEEVLFGGARGVGRTASFPVMLEKYKKEWSEP